MLQPWKKATSLFTKKKGSSSSKPLSTNFFEEALGFRVSSEHGGGHGTTEEEPHSSPRWHESHTKLVYEVYQTSRTYGGAARLTSPLDTVKEKLTRLEKRLVAHVDFDDQALQVLGFHTDIYMGAIL
jgi:hypothetical protein